MQKVAYTILNEAGDKWAYFSEWYDKLRSIESFDGTLYDAAGNKIKSLKKGDIKDESGGSDGTSLADDNRLKWHSFFYKVYPFTVEYEVEVRYKGTMFLPRWVPQERPVMGVQQSTVTVVTPASNPLKYKSFNYKGEPVTTTDSKSNKVYTWEVKNIVPATSEFASPGWHELTASVFMATEKFMLEDYEGSNTNWKEFGRFVYDLKKDRDGLSDDVKQKVHQLINGITDTREKIDRLYSYMQENTRYISIQLGVGGWQPFSAKYVSEKKYGDCKALSNYMYALLKEAGIRSVYTVTGRGYDLNYFLPDLPYSQFNHVVLFVPSEKDTIWLECTSQTLPAGYVGADNCNRQALAVDENGGVLVNTPVYGIKENLQVRNSKATLEADATLNIKSFSTYGGIQQDRYHDLINSLSKDKLKEVLHEDLDFATYDIKNFEYREKKSVKPEIEESLDIRVSNYATITGKRLFILPNIMSRHHRKLSADSARKYDIDFSYEYKDVDTVEISLPAGYTAESMPQDVTVNSKFGKYQSTVRLSGSQLFYFRSMEHNAGRFPASDYTELVKFYETIYKADRSKVVLVKKE
ncbi:MAG: DUF3857 and transglutaminase domain-containing protein [Chitinophagaceae bacterium]|nr:DUF3857 and transglutaminase domain-containing protein [Chitinophagaceae bacterium]